MMEAEFNLSYKKYIAMGIEHQYLLWDDYQRMQFLNKMKSMDINFAKMVYIKLDEDMIDEHRESWAEEAVYLQWILESFVIPEEQYELAKLLKDYIEYIKHLPGDKV